jgi:flagellar basal-body rod modification protein FlgD
MTIAGAPSAAAGSSSQAASSKEATANPGATLTKESFLRLLVAQIKHQNPLNPADGVQFLTQLAEFSGLEQLLSIRQDVSAIRQAAVRGQDSQGTQESN